MSKNAKKPTLNDILDLAIELARRHSDASPELAAALREYDADLQCAWKKTAPMLPAKEEAAVRPRRRRGRPNRVASGAPLAEQANRNASWLVAFMMREWRVKHGRQRVPAMLWRRWCERPSRRRRKRSACLRARSTLNLFTGTRARPVDSSFVARIRHLLCPKPISPDVYG
jgi:hypothetical protein